MSYIITQYNTLPRTETLLMQSIPTQGGFVSSAPPPPPPKKWVVKKSPGGSDSGSGALEIVKVTLFYVLFESSCGTK